MGFIVIFFLKGQSVWKNIISITYLPDLLLLPLRRSLCFSLISISWSSPAVVTGQWLAEQAFPLCQDGTRDWRKAGTHWASEQQQQKREASNAYLIFFTVWPFKKRKKERKKEKKDPAGQPLSLKSLGHLVVVRMCSMCLYSEDFNVKMRSYLIADAYTVTDQIEQRKYQCNP